MNIVLEGITKKYRRGTRVQTVLKDINLEMTSGNFWFISGESGSGKSTLLNIIAGLSRVTEGKVFYGERELTNSDEKVRAELRRKYAGIATQDSDLVPYLSVYENMQLASAVRGDAEGNREEYENLLDAVGLLPLKKEYPENMSGGEIKRAAIARALVAAPSVIIMDEPTANLDRENVKKVLTLLRKTADSGSTVIISSHEKEARTYCDKEYNLVIHGE